MKPAKRIPTPDHIVAARAGLRHVLDMAGQRARGDVRYWRREDLLFIAEKIVQYTDTLLPAPVIDEDDDAIERALQITQERG